MPYYVRWIDEEITHKPNLKGSPKAIIARSPLEAWETFHKEHPNLRDGEGDYYVMISTDREPREDETDVVAEAGELNGEPYFRPWKDGLPAT